MKKNITPKKKANKISAPKHAIPVYIFNNLCRLGDYLSDNIEMLTQLITDALVFDCCAGVMPYEYTESGKLKIQRLSLTFTKLFFEMRSYNWTGDNPPRISAPMQKYLLGIIVRGLDFAQYDAQGYENVIIDLVKTTSFYKSEKHGKTDLSNVVKYAKFGERLSWLISHAYNNYKDEMKAQADKDRSEVPAKISTLLSNKESKPIARIAVKNSFDTNDKGTEYKYIIKPDESDALNLACVLQFTGEAPQDVLIHIDDIDKITVLKY